VGADPALLFLVIFPVIAGVTEDKRIRDELAWRCISVDNKGILWGARPTLPLKKNRAAQRR